MPGRLNLSQSGTNSMADGWFHTWPDRSYEKLENSTPPDVSPHHRAPIPLSSLLSHMSLAYSPITKGLHVLKKPQSDSEKEEMDEETADEVQPVNNIDKPKVVIDLFQNKGKDLVLQSCLTQLEGEEDKEAWNSKIGYEEGNDNTQEKDEGDLTDDVNDPEVLIVCEEPRTGRKSSNDRECCLLRTEASSFSSIVSSLSDASPSQPEDSASGNVSYLDVEDDKSHNSIDCSEQSKFFLEHSPKVAKKKGISGFFSKNVFTWKNTGGKTSPATWGFLGKAFSGGDQPPDSLTSLSSNSSLRGSSLSISDSGSTQKYGNVVASSSALILHDRPASLPAKSEGERDKHRQEYQGMVEAAKKKEENDSKLRKKTIQQQLKQEEHLAKAVRIWNSEILPRWSEVYQHKKTKELWWLGLPPSVRGKIWRLAIGNDLNITHQLYEICAARAHDRLNSCNTDASCSTTESTDKESSMELIQLDIARTFPHLCIFQKSGPYYDILHCLLGAYVCYRPDVGYVQGMSFLAAILILNLDPPDAFICFANLLNRPCLHAFYTLCQPQMQAYYDAYNELFKENVPKLYDHFNRSALTPDLYLLDWVYSVFVKAMNLDTSCRIWDVFLRDGEEFIFRTAIGILHLYEKELLELDFVHGAQFLTRLPENLSADQLFKSIESVKMNAGKMKFSQILSSYISRCTGR